MATPERTLIEIAAENVGILKTGQALANLVTWCWSMNRHPGVELTAELYAEDWLVSKATGYRHRKLVFDAFDGVDLDQVAELIDQLGQGKRSQRGALRVAGAVAPIRVLVT